MGGIVNKLSGLNMYKFMDNLKIEDTEFKTGFQAGSLFIMFVIIYVLLFVNIFSVIFSYIWWLNIIYVVFYGLSLFWALPLCLYLSLRFLRLV